MQLQWLQAPSQVLSNLDRFRKWAKHRPLDLPPDKDWPAWLETAPTVFWESVITYASFTSETNQVNYGWAIYEAAKKHQSSLFVRLPEGALIELPWQESQQQIDSLVAYWKSIPLPPGSLILSALPNVPERYWAFLAAAMCGFQWMEIPTTASEPARVAILAKAQGYLCQEETPGYSMWEDLQHLELPPTLFLPKQSWLVKESTHTNCHSWHTIIQPVPPPPTVHWLDLHSPLYAGHNQSHGGWLLKQFIEGIFCQDLQKGEILWVNTQDPEDQLGGLRAWLAGGHLLLSEWPIDEIQHLEISPCDRLTSRPAGLRSLLTRTTEGHCPPWDDVMTILAKG